MNDGKKIISIGGTFSVLHDGHKKYIETAFKYGDEVWVFLSSDEQAEIKKKYEPPPYSDRQRIVSEFCDKFNKNYKIIPIISDDFLIDFLSSDEKIDIMLITPEYYPLARKINRKRAVKALILIMDRIKKYKSSRYIKRGEICNNTIKT